MIYLYANNKDEQYSYIEAAKNKGYNVLLMNGQLDVAMVSMLEQKFEKVRFTRVDSDVIDNLIVKEDKKNDVLDAGKQEALSAIFKSQLPQIEKTEFSIMAQSLGENASPVMITQSEYMRRMKEMANIQAGMSFYGEMPDMFNLVLNADHKLVKEILDDEDRECTAAIAPVQKEMDDINNRRNELKKKQEGKKDEEISTVEKDEVDSLDKKWEELKAQKESLFANYAAHNKVVRQLIDLALLQNGMLKGEALNNPASDGSKKSRRLSCPTAAAPPSARGNGGERRTSARQITPHDLPFRKLNLSLTQINTPDVRHVFQTGFGFIGIRPPSRIPTHRVPGHCVQGDFSCYPFIRIRRIRSAAPRRCTNTNNDNE